MIEPCRFDPIDPVDPVAVVARAEIRQKAALSGVDEPLSPAACDMAIGSN
jgi:hypothetical protein